MPQSLKEPTVRIYFYKDNCEKTRNPKYGTISSLFLKIIF